MSATFLGFPAAPPALGMDADIALIGIPHGTPYRKGETSHSAGSPAALRAVTSRYADKLDHHDYDLGGPLLGGTGARVVDCGDVAGDPADPDDNRAVATAAVRTILGSGSVPVALGGDDSVVIPFLTAFEDHGPLCVVQVDAHIDWRDEVGGERHGYSSPMRRASEMPWVTHMVQVGLRGVGSARAGEVADAERWGSKIVTARDLHEAGVDAALRHVPAGARCVITVDCDGLDPSVIPAVAAPAPGGMTYWQAVDLIHGVARRARVVGFDLVELAPARDTTGHSALAAARLVCNAIGAIARTARDDFPRPSTGSG
jgi:agmatinase